MEPEGFHCRGLSVATPPVLETIRSDPEWGRRRPPLAPFQGAILYFFDTGGGASLTPGYHCFEPCGFVILGLRPSAHLRGNFPRLSVPARQITITTAASEIPI